MLLLLSLTINTSWILLLIAEHFSREFTHRVKSVSMAKFTADEVSALHAGGNEVRFAGLVVTSSVQMNVAVCVLCPVLTRCSWISVKAGETDIFQRVGSSSQFSTRWQVLGWSFLLHLLQSAQYEQYPDVSLFPYLAFSNPYKLRDFIKHVYVDRRFTGEEGTEKPPKLRLVSRLHSFFPRGNSGS